MILMKLCILLNSARKIERGLSYLFCLNKKKSENVKAAFGGISSSLQHSQYFGYDTFFYFHDLPVPWLQHFPTVALDC